jgi:hypothetical protein
VELNKNKPNQLLQHLIITIKKNKIKIKHLRTIQQEPLLIALKTKDTLLIQHQELLQITLKIKDTPLIQHQELLQTTLKIKDTPLIQLLTHTHLTHTQLKKSTTPMEHKLHTPAQVVPSVPMVPMVPITITT